MNAEQVKSLWQRWQDENPTEAASICEKFTTACIVGGFKKAERRLIATIATKINAEWAEVARAINRLNPKRKIEW